MSKWQSFEEREAIIDPIIDATPRGAAISDHMIQVVANKQGVTPRTIRRWLNADPRVVSTSKGPMRSRNITSAELIRAGRDAAHAVDRHRKGVA